MEQQKQHGKQKDYARSGIENEMALKSHWRLEYKELRQTAHVECVNNLKKQ